MTARNRANFDGSEKLVKGLFFFIKFLIIMLEKHVNFYFQQISSRIIRVFYVLCNFPDG